MEKDCYNTNIEPKKLNFLQEIKASVSSQKNLSQKEAELVLVGKKRWMVSFVIARPRSQNLEYWVYLCMFLLICLSQLIRIYGHKFF